MGQAQDIYSSNNGGLIFDTGIPLPQVCVEIVCDAAMGILTATDQTPRPTDRTTFESGAIEYSITDGTNTVIAVGDRYATTDLSAAIASLLSTVASWRVTAQATSNLNGTIVVGDAKYVDIEPCLNAPAIQSVTITTAADDGTPISCPPSFPFTLANNTPAIAINSETDLITALTELHGPGWIYDSANCSVLTRANPSNLADIEEPIADCASNPISQFCFRTPERGSISIAPTYSGGNATYTNTVDSIPIQIVASSTATANGFVGDHTFVITNVVTPDPEKYRISYLQFSVVDIDVDSVESPSDFTTVTLSNVPAGATVSGTGTTETSPGVWQLDIAASNGAVTITADDPADFVGITIAIHAEPTDALGIRMGIKFFRRVERTSVNCGATFGSWLDLVSGANNAGVQTAVADYETNFGTCN